MTQQQIDNLNHFFELLEDITYKPLDETFEDHYEAIQDAVVGADLFSVEGIEAIQDDMNFDPFVDVLRQRHGVNLAGFLNDCFVDFGLFAEVAV